MNHEHHHAVQFYENDDSLFATVAGFLEEGFKAGQPAVVIATAPHRAAIQERLAADRIAVSEARRLGDLVLLDADATLATFMVRDVPDPELFARHVGTIIEQVIQGRAPVPVRAYGEMVDVLWKQGKPDAAIKLEILWNDLAARYSFSLLCGYAIGNFYKQTDRREEVSRLHTHVVDERRVIPSAPPALRSA